MAAREAPPFETSRLQRLLDLSASRHQHLCPRQVLGVRLGLAGLRRLGLLGDEARLFANEAKRLLVIVETDGCGADGVAVATDSSIGRRTLRVEDYGKLAATLVDTWSGEAWRVWPEPTAREMAARFAPEADSDWHAYLLGYQRMPEEQLVASRPVRLRRSLEAIISRPGARALCARCGEEVMNEREYSVAGATLCPACAGTPYYEDID